jgi:ubiquinone/menaquinone biosynthesis C-methylase UbiE
MVSERRWIGVDPLDFPVEREFQFVQVYADALPFRDAVFEGVVFCSTLDHALDPSGALSEAHRVLEPGGVQFVEETVRPEDDRFRQWRRTLEHGGSAR